jgi:hypothetical protein
MLLPEEATSLKLFDPAYENFQSVSRAQRFYLSFLLVYLSVVWGWYFAPQGRALHPLLLGTI